MGFSAGASDTGRFVVSDINLTFTIPTGHTNADLDSIFLFIPPEWFIAPQGSAGSPPIGAIVGGIDTLVTLGVLNSPCAGVLNPSFVMFEATTDTTVTTDLVGGITVEPNFLFGGVNKYSEWLNVLFPGEQPIERLYGVKQVTATTVAQINILIFEPGSLGFSAALGYPTVGVLNDPTLEIPQDVSDFCTPLMVSINTFGTSIDNPNTAACEGIPTCPGFVKLRNPSNTTTEFSLITESDPDADTDVESNFWRFHPIFGGSPGGSLENDIDTCPFNGNVEGPLRGPVNIIPLAGALFDSLVPPIPPFNGDPDGDSIDSACDVNPLAFDGVDADGDLFLNRQDNCPQLFNQALDEFGNPILVPNPIGPGVLPIQKDADSDGIGDDCDPNPNTVNGHTHQAILTVPITIGNHGVKLEDVEGPDEVAGGASANYRVQVENKSDSVSQDIEVALRVVEGCATVNGDADSQDEDSVNVVGDGSRSVSFSVDWSGCADGTYTLQADACHAGDTGTGFYGAGDCPGDNDGHSSVDPADLNALDDAPISINVKVGG